MVAVPEPARPVPSIHTVRAAQNAAKSPHGLVNLIRLIASLDAAATDLTLDDEDDKVERQRVEEQVAKDIQAAVYARAMLEALKSGNEGASSTKGTLDDLDRTLTSLEDRYTVALAPRVTSLPLSKTLSRVSAVSSRVPTRPSSAMNHTPVSTGTDETSQNPRSTTYVPPTTLRKRKNPPLSTYLQTRAAEDTTGTDAGLLPIRAKPVPPAEKSSRDQLLGAGTAGMGAAQLHEELGGQLADMSHRLKLNAVHFSNSLEAEKALLETSQETLENNLTATRSSKKNLSAVSKKGRGTTCMTLGVVILVLIIFVWTYMLIRFT
ncbi:hypothetical protein DB88DRAFT_488940 [Papiliotrema laurentii]|uniref:Uncharacterized protein n=1 Tax=Papiliotrema laurentii TaxID=5418 RepID=A0AAD9FP16_PAPLA|nr:hypothetical protein DB88DRAFT_488940 [Papiliotrema laurentii]